MSTVIGLMIVVFIAMGLWKFWSKFLPAFFKGGADHLSETWAKSPKTAVIQALSMIVFILFILFAVMSK